MSLSLLIKAVILVPILRPIILAMGDYTRGHCGGSYLSVSNQRREHVWCLSQTFQEFEVVLPQLFSELTGFGISPPSLVANDSILKVYFCPFHIVSRPHIITA